MGFLWLLEGLRTPFWDKAMQLVTHFGEELFVIAIICILYWCVNKQLAYQLGFSYFTAGLSVQVLKITFRIPRPWVLDPSFHAVESAVPKATGYSFPSGHTQGAGCLFVTLSLQTGKGLLKALCILVFALVGFSRMYLGCHTPRDVIAAAGTAVFFSCLVQHFRDFLLCGTRHLKLVALTLGVCSAAAAAYALLLLRSGIIAVPFASDCCKAAGAGLGFAAGWYVERTKIQFDTKTRRRWYQIPKLAIGIAAVLLIKQGSEIILGASIPAKMLQYFLMVVWVLVIYPFLFSRNKFSKIRIISAIQRKSNMLY